ncbi:hypothetical protein BHE74_00025102, partial [Ensete ventricosum]
APEREDTEKGLEVLYLLEGAEAPWLGDGAVRPRVAMADPCSPVQKAGDNRSTSQCVAVVLMDQFRQ